jgi:hypothetical protein
MQKYTIKWEDISVKEMFDIAEEFDAIATVDGDSHEVIFEWGKDE